MADETSATIEGRWDIRYKYAAGKTATRFFRELRESGRILAAPCSVCGRVLMPPRSFCERCFEPTGELVEVGPGGVVETFTMTRARFAGVDDQRAQVIALVKLDGADTKIAHYLEDVEDDPEALFARVKRGLRVEAVLEPAEKRRGSLLDIRGFRPVAGGDHADAD